MSDDKWLALYVSEPAPPEPRWCVVVAETYAQFIQWRKANPLRDKRIRYLAAAAFEYPSPLRGLRPETTEIVYLTNKLSHQARSALSAAGFTPPPLKRLNVTAMALDRLERATSGVQTKVACPACLVGRDFHSTVWSRIQHLNDIHRWPREQIADWLDTLDIDLTINLEEEPCPPQPEYDSIELTKVTLELDSKLLKEEMLSNQWSLTTSLPPLTPT
jgi:hypothetical protein